MINLFFEDTTTPSKTGFTIFRLLSWFAKYVVTNTTQCCLTINVAAHVSLIDRHKATLRKTVNSCKNKQVKQMYVCFEVKAV